jgi:hypothetical protein
MADDAIVKAGDAGSDIRIATDEANYDGANASHAQLVKLVDATADSTTRIAAGGGVEATALRVTLASDSTGVVSVDDNGGSLTVDGTVAVTSAGITTIAGAVAGTEMQVDVVAALPAGNNNIGDVDVASLPALPAGNNNIGDVDVASVVPGTGATNLGKAEDAAHTTGDTGVAVLAVRSDAGGSFAADGDYVPFSTDAVGNLRTVAGGAASAATVTQVACSTSSATLLASSASRKGVIIFNDAAVALYVKFGATASSTSFTVKIAAGGYWEMAFTPHGIYYGIIDGILASSTGNAYVTSW